MNHSLENAVLFEKKLKVLINSQRMNYLSLIIPANKYKLRKQPH